MLLRKMLFKRIIKHTWISFEKNRKFHKYMVKMHTSTVFVVIRLKMKIKRRYGSVTY